MPGLRARVRQYLRARRHRVPQCGVAAATRGLPRRADGASQPRAFPRRAGGGDQRRGRQRLAGRPAADRPRRLQAGQRHARPCGRRRGLAHRRPASHADGAHGRHRRAPGWRRVRRARPPDGPSERTQRPGRAPARGPVSADGAGHARLEPRRRDRTDRLPARRLERERPAALRRPRDVPREARGQRRLERLRRRGPQEHAPAHLGRDAAARRAEARAHGAALPAARRPRSTSRAASCARPTCFGVFVA